MGERLPIRIVVAVKLLLDATFSSVDPDTSMSHFKQASSARSLSSDIFLTHISFSVIVRESPWKLWVLENS